MAIRLCVVFSLWLCCLLIPGEFAASVKEFPVSVSERSDSEGSGALLTPQIPPESRPNDVSDDGSGDDSIFATLLVAVVITMIVMGGLIILCLLGVCTVCIIMYFRRNRDALPDSSSVVYTNQAFEEYTGSPIHQPDQDSYSFSYSPMSTSHPNTCSSVCNSLPSLFQASSKWAMPAKSVSEGDRLDSTVLRNTYMLQPSGSLPREYYPEQATTSAQCGTYYSTPV